MSEKVYTPETLAQEWGCSTGQVRRLCRQGRLRHFRLGKLYRIRPEHVREFERENEVCGGSSSTGESGPPDATASDSQPALKQPRKTVRLPNGRRAIL